MNWTPAPGMAVVCIDGSQTNSRDLIEIVDGQVYTIRAVIDPDELANMIFGRPLDEPGLLLVEVLREVEPELGEMPFGAGRFRPIERDDARLQADEAVPA